MSRIFGMRTRLWLAAALPAMLATTLLLLGFLYRHQQEMSAALSDRAQATARQLAKAAEFPLFAGNPDALQRLADGARVADRQIEGVAILAPQGMVVVAAGQLSVLPQPSDGPGEARMAGERLRVSVPIWSTALAERDPFSDPLDMAGTRSPKLLGHVVVELNLEILRSQRRELLVWALLAAGSGLLFAGLLSVLIASSVTGPIARVSRAVDRLSGGDLGARVDAGRSGVLQSLAEGINEMALSLASHQDELQHRVREATEELRRQKEEAERSARIDPLTGLLNRRAFTEAAETEIRRALRHGQPLSLIVVDLDHFKAINDSLGHATGDAVLEQFACLATREVRREDAVGRLGGEEFVVLLPGTAAAGALQMAERLRKVIADSGVPVEGRDLKYTASFGVAQLDLSQPQLSELLSRADAALYAAKRQGRNRVELARAEGAAGLEG